MEVAYTTLLNRPVASSENDTESSRRLPFTFLGNDGKKHPRIISLGGDHTIVWIFIPTNLISALNQWLGPSHSSITISNIWSNFGHSFRCSFGHVVALRISRCRYCASSFEPWHILLGSCPRRTTFQHQYSCGNQDKIDGTLHKYILSRNFVSLIIGVYISCRDFKISKMINQLGLSL